MLIYAIIVTYNGAKWIDKCFGSLVNSSIPVKILAIDNGSTDGTPTLIKEKFPQVEIIETGLNLGFGKANNIGLKRVLDKKADYAFLLNQDAWVEEDTIETLIGIQQKHHEFGILSPIEYYKPNQLDIKFEKFYAPKELLINLSKNTNTTYSTNFINAAAWLITYETIFVIGGFDPIYSHYGEDVDYCNRVKRKNKQIGIATATKYFHDRPQLLMKDSDLNKQIHYNQIRRILFMRWGNEYWIKRFIINIKEYLLDIINKKGQRIQNIKNCCFLIKNLIKISNKRNYHLNIKI